MRAGRVLAVASVAAVVAIAVSGCTSSDSNGDSTSQYDFGVQDVKYDADASGELPEDEVISGGVVGEYPSAELLIRITEPSGHGYATTVGSVVSLSGVVFGKYSKVAWASSTANGTIATTVGSPFWQTDGIALVPGDNILKVSVAAENGESVSDIIVVTSNPGFMLPNPVQMRPPAMFVGQTQSVLATIALGPFGSVSGSTVTLKQVDATGVALKDLGGMLDDGQVASSGDEITRDGVYTLRLTLSCTTPGPVYLRAAIPVKDALGNPYSALSAPTRFDCVNRLASATCSSHQKLLSDAQTAYFTDIEGGGTTTSARTAAVQVLRGDPTAAQTVDVADGGGLWIRWNDGVMGAVNLARAGDRGGDGSDGGSLPDGSGTASASVSSGLTSSVPILSKDTLLLSPFADEFGSDDETLHIANLAAVLACPAYNVATANNKAANLDKFRHLSSNGIVALATHSDVYFRTLAANVKTDLGWHHPGGAEVLWTGESVTCGNLSQTDKTCTSKSECPTGNECVVTMPAVGDTSPAYGSCYDTTQVDLMTGRAILGASTWGISPAFVDYHTLGQPFPSSLVYLGGCKTLYNGTMATSLFAAGARAIAGFSGTVTTTFAAQMARQFFSGMMESGYPAGQAYGVGAQDPAHPGSFFRLFGAKGLTISESAILNEGFETGDITAWTKDGDGRVITQLGLTKPVEGKFMGIISTGLGYTSTNGSLEQKFCIFPGTKNLTFWWKYYSEEFPEFCGQIYQDSFQATITDKTQKQYKVVSLAVDDLCPKTAQCPSCGKKSVGIVTADVGFDQSTPTDIGVWVTGKTNTAKQKGDWQKATYDISSLVTTDPAPITLRFYTTDHGDSIYDTAVLIDGLKFE